MQRTLVLVGGIASGLLSVSPAWAQRDERVYVACYVYRVPGAAAAYLPVVPATRWDFNNNFELKAEKAVLPSREPGQHLSCKSGDTPEAADAARVKTGYLKVSELPWPRDFALSSPPEAPKPVPVPAPAPAPALVARTPAPSASLTARVDTSAQDAARAWDEQVRNTLAAEARKKVEAAARQVQADAKRQAEIATFFAERRKQGRAQ